MTAPLTIRMHEADNVAIVANDGGLAAGTVLPSGLVLLDRVPQGHKVALVDIAAGAPVRRYGIPIGHALQAIAAGRWVHERLLALPDVRGLTDLPMATARALTPVWSTKYFASCGSVKPVFSVDCPSLATYPSSASTLALYLAAVSTTLLVISIFSSMLFSLA